MKNEDYLDDLLSSVSSRDDRNDIEDLLGSVRDGEERMNRDRESRKRRRDFGEQFYQDFEKELGIEDEDEFVRDFELELDAEEADRQMDDFPKEVFGEPVEEQLKEEPAEPFMESVDGIVNEAKKRVEGDEESDISAEGNALENFSVGNELVEEPVTEGVMEELVTEQQEEMPIEQSAPIEEVPLMQEEQIQDEESIVSETGDASADDLLQMLTGLSEDSDLSDIGALLKAEENGESIEPEDGGDDMEMLESIQALSGISSGKKGKKEKGGKKNRAQGEKKGFSKLLATLFGEDEEDQIVHVSEEGTLENISDENLDILRELDSEKAKEEKPKKEKKKKEKKEKKEKPKKEKKVKPKKEKKPKEKDTSPPLPKKPVILIVVMAASVFLLIWLGSNFINYSSDMSEAKENYRNRDYVAAYTAISGMDVKEKDETFYNKCAVMAMIQSEYDAYVTLMDIDEYTMALDCLIRGIGRYDKYYEKAEEYDILLEYNELELKIEQILGDQFGVNKEQALELYKMRDREDYSIAVGLIMEGLGLE